jgi:hypothetical protein
VYPRPTGPVVSTVRRRRVPVIAAVVLVLVCAGGALGITAGVQWLGGYFTGNESGPNVLVGPASGSAGELTLTVTDVWVTAHFTRVQVTASNTGAATLTLPLFKNAQLTGQDGSTQEADAFRSHWTEDVPPGGLVKGILVFPGHPAGGGTLRLTFGVVFGSSGGGSIGVDGIALTHT